MKKVALVFALCGIAAIIGFIAVAFPATQGPSVGIIGGADGPTAILLVRSTGHLPMTVLSFGGAMLISGLFALIFNRSMAKNCSLRTSAISLGISASVSLEAFAFFLFASCYFLSNPNKHPIRHPVSLLVGIFALVALVSMICIYAKIRSKNKSLIGVLWDACLALLFLVPFSLAYNTLYELARHFFG